MALCRSCRRAFRCERFCSRIKADAPRRTQASCRIDRVRITRAFAGDGFRVFHRGVDQRVEIEILDVEGLAHVRAALFEELHDGGLIVNRIEFGLERFRTRRHLRERERSGKHFDEDQIHRV